MKMRFPGVVSLGLLLVSLTASAESGDFDRLTTGRMNQLARGNTAFAAELYGQLLAKQQGKNFFFSPYNISMALAMTYEGARGQTRADIERTLHFGGLEEGGVADVFPMLDRQLRPGNSSYELATANRLFGQQNFSFSKGYLGLLEKKFKAPMGLYDFTHEETREKARAEINAWVEGQTNQRIRQLLQKPHLTEQTRLVLVSAIHFKGMWAAEFDKKATLQRPFQRADGGVSNVPMMSRTGSYRQLESDTARVVEIPYRGDAMSMLVILPKDGKKLADVEKQIASDGLSKILGVTQANKDEVDLWLPQFKQTWDSSLKDVLKNMGMANAFSGTANFSGMTTVPLNIDNVIHKAFVEVNEQGTEASAATAVMLSVDSLKVRPRVFHADRPFLYLILHRSTQSVLFMGRMMDPLSQ